MRLSTRVTVVAGALLLGLTACVPTTPTPAPTDSSSPTPRPTATSTAAPSDPDEPEATAAVVVMTASSLSVFATDGSTLASVTYEMDGAAAASLIADALDAEPVVTALPGDGEGPCAPATAYDFGGLLLRSPGSLWSHAPLEVIVTAATTAGGVGIETIAAQRIGAAQADFQAAIGEFMVLYETDSTIGFDILNPEAHEWDRVGTYAEFTAGALDYLATPNRLGFVGSCA